MNERLYEALEVCIQALETGADLEGVLKRYPQMTDELRPLLEAVAQAQSLSIPSAPEDAIKRGRARVLQHAAEMRESSGKPRVAGFSFARLAASLALALIFIFSGVGLVRASSDALPGDNLYRVKRTWEDVRLLLMFDAEGREGLAYEFEMKRLEEVSKLLAEGRFTTVSFTGVVEQIDGNQWLVSGINVLITADSQLPPEPVTVGASISVEGHTNSQGLVEVERVELLKSGIILTPFVPVEIETPEEENFTDNPSIEENSNDDEGAEVEESSDDENDNINNDNDNGDDDSSSDSNRNDDNSGDDKDDDSDDDDDDDNDDDDD